MGDFQNHRVGKFHFEGFAVPGHHAHLHALLEVLAAIPDLLGREAGFLVGAHVHEHVVIGFHVGVLQGAFLKHGLGEHLPGTKRLFHDVAALDCLQLGAHKSGALAGLHMQKFHNPPDIAIQLNRGTGSKVVAGDHSGGSDLADCTAGYRKPPQPHQPKGRLVVPKSAQRLKRAWQKAKAGGLVP